MMKEVKPPNACIKSQDSNVMNMEHFLLLKRANQNANFGAIIEAFKKVYIEVEILGQILKPHNYTKVLEE